MSLSGKIVSAVKQIQLQEVIKNDQKKKKRL